MAADLVLALALVLANAFFVAAEFAIARLRPTQVFELARDRRPGARSAQHAVEHIDAYLSACQLGITLASLGLGAVGERAFHGLLEPLLGDNARIAGFGLASAIAFLIITMLHVVLGELAPKSAAISRTVPIALALAPIMRGFYFVTKPLVDLFNGLGNLVLKPFGIPPASEAGHAPHSERELRLLLRESREGGLIQREEQQLSEAALVFGDRRAREVMTPRHQIDYVTTADTPREVAAKAIQSGHTRLPLCEPDRGLEGAIGFINVKDLLPIAFGQPEVDARSLARPLAQVPESARVDEVLREMRRDRRHLALVLDEHGTVVGLDHARGHPRGDRGGDRGRVRPAHARADADGGRVAADRRLGAGAAGGRAARRPDRGTARGDRERPPDRAARPRPGAGRGRRPRRRPRAGARGRRHADHCASESAGDRRDGCFG